MIPDTQSPLSKDVLFLASGEPRWQSRYELARSCYPNVQLVTGAASILDAFKRCCNRATTDLFVLIDGDNEVVPGMAGRVMAVDRPSLFLTTNPLGITYGHGGIKVLSRTTNLEFKSVLDVTAKLGLELIPEVASHHQFALDPWGEWKTIFKELLKLHMWQNAQLLNQWLAHDYPRSIFYQDVLPWFRATTIQGVLATLKDQTIMRAIYENRSSSGNL